MKAKGFTLIELAVVLAVIAVLAAILTPLVTGYLDQARTARAMSEAKTIADAVRLYHRDTAKYPIYTSLTTTANYEWQVGPGVLITDGITGTTTTLVPYLTTNVVGFTTTARLGNIGYRGPYIASLETDPWGNAYYVSAAHLNTNINWAIVTSAGADGAFSTTLTQPKTAAFSASGDDVVAIIK